ncbi:insulin-like 3 [Bombina bombina]|uniref:insulin-like 3 n=1 Tax=Bombina bombina TaxID=8345 RepID=UPI00235AF0C1|nr:insulin-like 3 [Bombina bombina]
MSLHLFLLAMLFTLQIPSWCHAEGPEIGMKLCGREFIRTVVMSCGGSRWKRYSPEPGQERDNPYSDLMNWLNRDFMENPESLNLVPEDDLRSKVASSSDMRDVSMEQFQGSLYDPLVGDGHQDISRRMKRSVGPAGSCCQRGCTKTELMKFC